MAGHSRHQGPRFELNGSRLIVDGIPASGWTPLSETFYEAALYWRGMGADYGALADTDTDALFTTDPMQYKQPAEYACWKNFVVLLTDGAPTQDVDAYFKTPTLPGYLDATGRGYCTGGNVSGACLDDIAEHLQNTDINPSFQATSTSRPTRSASL